MAEAGTHRWIHMGCRELLPTPDNRVPWKSHHSRDRGAPRSLSLDNHQADRFDSVRQEPETTGSNSVQR